MRDPLYWIAAFELLFVLAVLGEILWDWMWRP